MRAKRISIYNIILAVFAAATLVGAGLVYFSLIQQRQDLFQSAVEEKVKLAEMIKETVASPSWFYQISLLKDLEKGLIAGLSRFKDVRFIRIVKIDGEIYQSSLPGETGKRIKEPNVVKVIQSGQPLIRNDVFQNEEVKLLIYPGYENQTIWIGFSFKETEALAQNLLRRYFFIALAALLLLSLALLAILRSVVDPIRRMTATCEDVRRGNLDVRTEVGWQMEIGELAETFNKMLEDLRASRQSLEESKEILEIRVSARTKELEDLALGLESQVKERTKDLQEKMGQLEKFNKLAVDRELKMIELKKDIKKLKTQLDGAKATPQRDRGKKIDAA
ncbi:MAG: HAMP domain-containing protein [Candidatus Nealsonbacteria bacterium]|nr:HAMP domain-containing protein [Candidatus Nealsonbacteria bacterium]